MALTTDEIKATWRRFIREQVATDPARWTKADLDAAVAATEAWLDANQASYVTALNLNAPAFGGANSTAAQKTWLFVYTVLARQGMI